MFELYKFEENQFVKHTVFKDLEELNFTIIHEMNLNSDILLKNVELKLDDVPTLLEHISANDIAHSGLNFISENNYLDELKSTVLHWPFLDPNKNVVNNSWKATADFCFFRKGIIKKNGGFTSGFICKNVTISEFVYRALSNGARIKYLPLRRELSSSTLKTKIQDELLFTYFHVGIMAIFLILIDSIIKLKFIKLSISIAFLARRKRHVKNIPIEKMPYIQPSKVKEIDRDYTAIIPTINRYEYIERAINSLLNNAIPPKEIIVVDQTPYENRNHKIYEQFSEDIVKVFFLEQPGQCSSRNYAIENAKFESILLFEDDAEAWPEMIEQHIKLLEYSNADCSTGTVLAPWKTIKDIRDNSSYYHITNVLSTGNAFIAKDIIKRVNGFNLAYNLGMGADDDFGRRLYLSGVEIVQNPFAIETHHKASKGGMRQHGGIWRDYFDFRRPYPNVTVMYTIVNYFAKKYWFRLILLHIYKVKKRNGVGNFILLLLLSPFKVSQSFIKAKKLIKSL